LNLVYGFNDEVRKFVSSLIPACQERGLPEESTAIGVANGDVLVGGFVYHNYDPDAGVIELSCASLSKRWFTRPVLYNLFAYPFLQIGCQMVCSRVSVKNAGLVRQKLAYGFTSHRIERLFGRDEDGIIFTLTKEQWMNNGFHKEFANGQA
jgi:hypothetical protein